MSAALLLAVAWKTALVAALTLGGAALLRTRPARERVALLRLGLLLVALLPLVAQQIPALRIETPSALAPVSAPPAPASEAVAVNPAVDVAAPEAFVLAEARADAAPAPRPAPPIGPWAIVAVVYAAGAGALLLRLALGVAVLARRTREARPVEDARWLAALDRAVGAGRRPRLLVSPRPLPPLSWGLRPGVILIGPDALAQPERADAVLTHELAHIRHGDWPFLMLSRLLVAAFWFNPLVWLLARELTRQSEHAADAWAVARVPRLDYAGALVALARSGRPQGAPIAAPIAALGMADSELAGRIKAVLAARAARGRPWPTAAAAVACVGLAGPLAALELAPATGREAPVAPAVSAEVAAAPLAAAAGLSRRPDAPAPIPAAAPPAPVADVAPTAAPSAQPAPGVANLENAARSLVASAALLRAQAENPDLRPHERARLQQEAADVEARAAHMRMQAGNIAARHAAQMQAEAQRGMAVSVDVRASRMPKAFIGAADMRNAADQMRADAGGMSAHADSLASGALLAPRDEAEIEAIRDQAEALREQADELDRQAEALGPP